MKRLYTTLAPVFLLLIAFSLIDAGISANYAEARSKMGGRSFKMTRSYKKSPARTTQSASSQKKSGMGRGLMGGLMGGLIGGALGGMLFGSLFGAGGSGMGILPILLLAGGAFFLYRKFSSATQGKGAFPSPRSSTGGAPQNIFGGGMNSAPEEEEPEIRIGGNLLEEGFEQIREHDRGFDEKYFKEVASDVFFQVQAGWMRREMESYRHLLGEEIASEYDKHFQEMKAKGHINKLESIAIRSVELTQAGSDGREDFISVIFKANLLDYTVDDKSGDLIEGSMTNPVKFAEEWSWARPTGTEAWKLEGIKVM
ncbi:MAG: preprotein translocase subunit Tim44 [Desulfotalea sp.]|nr:MAG: preprotein translocase subunit Tim44 [Desulfotalea sp.]